MVTATIQQTQQRMYTAAEFEAMSLPDGRFELLAGELIEMRGAGGQHGRIGVRFLSRLDLFTDERGLGSTYGPATEFVIQDRPDTVVVPDTAFVRAERLIPEREQTGFLRSSRISSSRWSPRATPGGKSRTRLGSTWRLGSRSSSSRTPRR